MNVVWFKRDLRLHDHAPLSHAASNGPCLCLFVYEPELIGSPEFHASHLEFVNQSLVELDAALQERGGCLVYRVGDVVEVLDRLHTTTSIHRLYSHEETGNKITFDRDKRVIAWARKHAISFQEFPQSGVVRRLESRDGWASRRSRFMAEPIPPAPTKIVSLPEVDAGRIHTADECNLQESTKTDLQIGGEMRARSVLTDFLRERGEPYSGGMSSPVTAWSACSRLSPYIAWGNISIRQVEQRLADRQRTLRTGRKTGKEVGNWLKSLNAFQSRLSWHCHFMQKLEDEPQIEFENMNRAYDGLREDERALHCHSWINFRMRAMLVSFASYHLWLHWRPTSVFLAQHFLDFEPGIHFSQFQMQSGTTGINALRIYSPIKQVKDQDPEGLFIRKHMPELSNVPVEFIAEPHKMPRSMQSLIGCVIGKDYPAPIVDHQKAYSTARARMGKIRKSSVANDESQRVMRRHGSRKKSNWR